MSAIVFFSLVVIICGGVFSLIYFYPYHPKFWNHGVCRECNVKLEIIEDEWDDSIYAYCPRCGKHKYFGNYWFREYKRNKELKEREERIKEYDKAHGREEIWKEKD